MQARFKGFDTLKYPHILLPHCVMDMVSMLSRYKG